VSINKIGGTSHTAHEENAAYATDIKGKGKELPAHLPELLPAQRFGGVGGTPEASPRTTPRASISPQSSISTAATASTPSLLSCGSASSSLLDLQQLAPAIDPYAGVIDLTHARNAARDLREILPALPAGASASQRKHHQALRTRLNNIIKLTRGAEGRVRAELPAPADGGAAPQLNGSELAQHMSLDDRVTLGYAIRDQYAKLSESAAALAKAVPAGQKPLWRSVSGAFERLKQTHLTAVAPDDKELYAQKEAKNLDQVAQGMGQARAGALLVTQGNSSASGMPVPGLTVSGTAGKGQLWVVDDDAATLYFGTKAGNASAKAGLPGVLALTGRAGAGVARDFVVGDSASQVIKHNLAVEANTPKEKLVSRSAGPKAREMRQAWDTIKSAAKVALGRSYVPMRGAPTHLSDSKLAKGYNTTTLHLLANHIDAAMPPQPAMPGATPKPTWAQTMQKYYPSVPQIAEASLELGQALPQATPLDLATPAPLAVSNRFLALKQPFAQVELTAGKEYAEHQPPVGWGAALIGKYDNLNVHVRGPRMTHELMDMGLMKDPAQGFKLVNDFDRELAETPRAPHLALYRAVREEVGGDKAMGAMPDAFYGDEVPAHMLEFISGPRVAKLDQIGTTFKSLARKAARLAVDGETLMAKADKDLPAAVKGELEANRIEAFNRLNESIWGARPNPGGLVEGGFPGGVNEALRRPEKFLAQSHNALSAALGLAGQYEFVLKRQLVLAGARDAIGAMRAADNAYMQARTTMDRTFLAIRKDNLVREHSSTDSTLVFNRHHGTGIVSVSGGGRESPLGRVTKVVGGDLKLPNADLGVVATAQVQTRIADYQVLDSRLGFDVNVTHVIESGTPFTGEIANRLVCKALEKANRPADQAKLHVHDVVDTVSQMLGSIEPRTGGLTLDIMFRQPPKGDAGSLELEYIRLHKSQSGGVNIMPTAGIGPVNGLSVSVAETRRSVQMEVLGPGIGYMSMHHGALTGAIDQASASLAQAAPPGPGGQPPQIAFHDAAAAVFLGDPAAGIEPDDFLRNRYFGKGNTIVRVLEKHLDAMHAITNNQMPQPGEPLPNEFFRYYTTEPFMRARAVANETAHHAPGSTADGKDPFQVPPALTDLPGLRILNAPAARQFDKSTPQWQAIKTRIEALKTPQERAQFFTQDPDGRRLFKTFSSVVDNIAQTWGATVNHAEKDRDARPAGFSAQVKSQAASRAQGPVRGDKPSDDPYKINTYIPSANLDFIPLGPLPDGQPPKAS
jgi:hypothetical protein